MRTVSFQGATLSGSERRSSQLRQQVRAAVNQSVLQQQVAATLNALEQHKEQGGKPEKVWSTISNERARRGSAMCSGGRDGYRDQPSVVPVSALGSGAGTARCRHRLAGPAEPAYAPRACDRIHDSR